MTKKQKGFTLVELMIVVAIIGILAAVAIPKFADMLEKSREGATKGYISAMKSAVANYLADNGGQVPYNLDTDTWTDPSGQIFPPYVQGNLDPVIARLSTYMDSIPAVKVTAKNKSNSDAKNGPGFGPSSNAVTYLWFTNAGINTFRLQSTAPRAAMLNDDRGWRYDRTSGSLWVNSAEWDMGGRTYTMFGYE